MEAQFAFGLMTFLSFFTGGGSLPLGVPPEEDPMMQKVAPGECLAYISWAGMATPKSDSENTTEALLAEPEVQRIIAEVDRRLVEALTAVPEGDDDSPQALLARHGVSLGRPLLMRPTAMFIEKFELVGDKPDVRGGALVNLGEDAAKVKAELERLQPQLAESVEEVEVAATPAWRLKFGPAFPEITWAVKGTYLIVGVGPESFEGILVRVKTDPPAWLANLLHRSEVRRVSSIFYVDLESAVKNMLPLAGPDAEGIRFALRMLGLDNVQSASVVSGLDRRGFVSNTHLKIAGEAGGLFTFISDKPLGPLDLQPVPADATLAVAVRADAEEIYGRLRRMAGGFGPGFEDEMDAELRRMEERSGVKIVDGIFKGLGDVWCAYNSPSEGGLIASGFTAAVTVRDHGKLKPEYDKVVKLMRDQMDEMRGFRGGRGSRMKEMKFGEHTIHYIAGDEFLWIAPAFCLTDEYLIFALFPQNVQAFLSRGADFQSLASSPHVGPRMKMQGGPSVIVYQDTQTLLKLLYPLLPMWGQMASRRFDGRETDFDISLLPSVGALSPHLNPGLLTIARDRDGITMESRQSLPGGVAGAAAPLMLGMYAPSIRDARLSARRVQSANNLKQIGLALHTYHDAHGRIPAAYSVDKEGKPLLSWRVHILPFVEQEELYRQFRLQEPWDSEHNRKLIAKMPPIFAAPTSKAAEGETVYLGVRGEKCVLSAAKMGESPERVTFADIPDGTSNTVMVVETGDGRAVEWTRPDDFEYDPKDPKAGLLGQHKEGFQALYCDGSVQFVSKRIDAETLRNLFNRADGNFTDHYRYILGRGHARRGGGWHGAVEAVPFDGDFDDGIIDEADAPLPTLPD